MSFASANCSGCLSRQHGAADSSWHLACCDTSSAANHLRDMWENQPIITHLSHLRPNTSGDWQKREMTFAFLSACEVIYHYVKWSVRLFMNLTLHQSSHILRHRMKACKNVIIAHKFRQYGVQNANCETERHIESEKEKAAAWGGKREAYLHQ